MSRVSGHHRLAARPGYESLASVLDAALDQAQRGKGQERHAHPGQPFTSQSIVRLNEQIGSTHGQLYQVCKKAIESERLPPARAIRELLGAINYAAAAVLVIQRRRRGSREARSRRHPLPRARVVRRRRKGAKR